MVVEEPDQGYDTDVSMETSQSDYLPDSSDSEPMDCEDSILATVSESDYDEPNEPPCKKRRRSTKTATYQSTPSPSQSPSSPENIHQSDTLALSQAVKEYLQVTFRTPKSKVGRGSRITRPYAMCLTDEKKVDQLKVKEAKEQEKKAAAELRRSQALEKKDNARKKKEEVQAQKKLKADEKKKEQERKKAVNAAKQK